MNHRITKLAVAAGVTAAAMLCIHHFGGSIDGTSVAWSQVVEEMNQYTRYKCRQRVVRKEGPHIPAMQVYHLNLQQRRQEVEDGSIHVIDMRGADAITVELYPDKKKATVTRLVGFGPRSDPHIIEMVKRFEQESTERLGTKELNGKTLQGFRHQPNEHNDFTVWVDPVTKLPVEIELRHTNRGQTIYLDQFGFDFELPPGAFSTDVPEGYEVKTILQDYRPVETKTITAQDMRTGLNHAAYTVGDLAWAKEVRLLQTTDPLTRQGAVYLTAIATDDGNLIILDQSNTQIDFKEALMAWINKERLTLAAPNGTKLYTHPNGAEYARLYLESLAKASPDMFDTKDLSKERFTRMILMPDETILGLAANKHMSDERLQELVEALKEIREK
ncbi:MAG: hypothetical protein IH624_18300 [Phycisphaerae bacterium]|nr:hypothetical protein [Phycisphaerae bacterium]